MGESATGRARHTSMKGPWGVQIVWPQRPGSACWPRLATPRPKRLGALPLLHRAQRGMPQHGARRQRHPQASPQGPRGHPSKLLCAARHICASWPTQNWRDGYNRGMKAGSNGAQERVERVHL